MSNCNDCRLAKWTNANDGICQWQLPKINLPTAFFYPGLGTRVPMPSGGMIRKDMPFRSCGAWKVKL